MSSQILVTGGAGFIGSHLTNRLVEQGYRVRVLDNFSTGRRSNLAAISGDVELIEGDIQNYERVDKAAARLRGRLSPGSAPSVPHSIADPLANNAVNVTGTLNVLLAARDHGARRVILASSSSVYGPTANGHRNARSTRRRRSRPTRPRSSRRGIRPQYHIAHGLETVALRYFNVFGPRQDPNSQYAAAIPNFVTALLRGEPPVIFGDGEQSRDFVYVANVVHANLLAMRSDEAPATSTTSPAAIGSRSTGSCASSAGCSERT